MTLVMNQLLDSRLIEEGDEERKEISASTSTKEHEEETMTLWNSVSLFDAEEEKTQGYKDVMETNVATRSQGTVKEDSLILPNIKRLQRNVKKKFQNKSLADKIPEFTITSQDPRKNEARAKPREENADKPHPIEKPMDYDIVEDLKKVKANVPLFEMCKVPQQKERLLKALEASDEKLPMDNRPQEEEEIGETRVGGKSKTKNPPFLLTFEIFNHNMHNCLVDSGASVNVMPISVCKKING